MKKWMDAAEASVYFSKRNKKIHSFGGWNCCDECREKAKKMITDFAHSAGKSARKTLEFIAGKYEYPRRRVVDFAGDRRDLKVQVKRAGARDLEPPRPARRPGLKRIRNKRKK